MSGTEKGQNVLLFVGDGGLVQFAGTGYSVVANTNGGVLHRVAGSFVTDGYIEGMLIHVEGFVDNETFHGIIASMDATDITLTNVMDEVGNPKVLVSEGAGVSVTITGEVFWLVRGQDDTQVNTAASAIDASTKDTGKWGASLSGTNRQTINVNGKVTWPDIHGVRRVFQEMEDQGLCWLKIVLNIAGDYYYGEYANTGLNIGGAKDGATVYTMTFENKLRPMLVEVA